MRIDVPEHLRGTFKLLENYGYKMKRRHGPGLRRHVKYDDVEESLYISVNLPDSDDWIDVTPNIALAEKREKEGSGGLLYY